ncbi:MAG: hypothetical protein PHG48_02790 [Eubacteriales bacterium]|nr:hypothetical protein [Eubacteriales bacterium]
MLKNNLISLAIHLVLSFIIGKIYAGTAQYCVEYTDTKFWIHLGLTLLTVLLYAALAAILLKALGGASRNFLSVILPAAAGLIIYAVDVHILTYIDSGYLEILYPAYIILFTPILEKLSKVVAYKSIWIVFALLPTLLMWMGLQLKAWGGERRRRHEQV